MTPESSSLGPQTSQTGFTVSQYSSQTLLAHSFEGGGMDELIRALVSTLPEELQFEFMERAAIIEFEAQTPREDAERRAWELLRCKLSK
jgi:hypothetical protein